MKMSEAEDSEDLSSDASNVPLQSYQVAMLLYCFGEDTLLSGILN